MRSEAASKFLSVNGYKTSNIFGGIMALKGLDGIKIAKLV